MKKKLIIPVVTLALTSLIFSAPSYGWFWDKKDKSGEAQTSTEDIKGGKKEKKENKKESSVDSTTLAPVTEATPPPVSVPKVQVKSPLTDEVNNLKVEDPVDSPTLPPEKTFVTIDDPKNPLGITVSAQKLNEASDMITQKRYKDADKLLTPLRDWLVDATEAHINIYKTLKNIPNAQVQAELEKQLALQFALLRDKAFFQLGMLAIGQEDYSNAVKNLSRVIQSQPRSPMGAQAYDVLQKIGFTEKIQLREEKKEDSSHVSQKDQS